MPAGKLEVSDGRWWQSRMPQICIRYDMVTHLPSPIGLVLPPGLTRHTLGHIGPVAHYPGRTRRVSVRPGGHSRKGTVVPAHGDFGRSLDRPIYKGSVLDLPVWNRTDMRRALAERDIALVYRILQRHGVSQRRIAAMTDQSQSEISEVLAGRRIATYDVLARIADGLNIARGRMGLAYDDDTVALLNRFGVPVRRDPSDIPLWMVYEGPGSS
jgi:hypothetical protein